MTGKALIRKHSLHEKTAASVLLKLFITFINVTQYLTLWTAVSPVERSYIWQCQVSTAAVAHWLERSPREREVVGSIPDRVIPKTL